MCEFVFGLHSGISKFTGFLDGGRVMLLIWRLRVSRGTPSLWERFFARRFAMVFGLCSASRAIKKGILDPGCGFFCRPVMPV